MFSPDWVLHPKHPYPEGAVWHQHSPSLPGCRDQSSQCTLPATWPQQNHSTAQEMLDLLQRKKKISLLHSIPWSSLLIFRLTLRRHYREHFFLTKGTVSSKHASRKKRTTKLLWVLSCPANSAGTDLLEHRGYCEQQFWSLSNEHQSVKQWREPQFIYGAAHRHLQFHLMSTDRTQAFCTEVIISGNWHLQFFTAAKGIVYYICSALGYNKKQKMRQKIL